MSRSRAMSGGRGNKITFIEESFMNRKNYQI